MRKLSACLAAGALMTLTAGPSFGAVQTIKGQVVDEGCSLKEMAAHKDGDHKMSAGMAECALECAKKGEPLALLTPDGKVYRITGGLAANKNERLIAHMNRTVEITGDVAEKDGKMTIAGVSLKALSK